MALVVKDRVRENSTTTGTGTLTLTGAVSGFQTFSSAIGNTETTYYAIVNNTEWEIGIGTVGAGTLTRDTVLESSNGGTKVNLSAGTKDVFCTYPAEKAVYLDELNNVNINTQISQATLTINGNAKIGRTTGGIPSTGTKLTLEADSLSGTSSPVELLRFGWTDSPNFDQLAGAGTKISFYQPSATVASEVAYVGAIKSSGIENDQGAHLVFATSPTGSTSSTPPTERMRINNAGNVGIGTNSPTEMLDVSGTVKASALSATNGMMINSNTVSSSYTIPTDYNAMSAGNVVINSGVTVTIPSGSRWVIV